MTDTGHGRDGDPWWASGADRLRPEADPLTAYRRVRLDRRPEGSDDDPTTARRARPRAASGDGGPSGGGRTTRDTRRSAEPVRGDGRRENGWADDGWADDGWADDGRDDEGSGAGTTRRGRGGRDERPDHVVDRSGLEEAIEGVAALLRAAGRRARREGRAARDHDPACRSCPWCAVTRSLGDARPEVTEHLEQAARHLVLAARAWVDAAEQRTTFERIPIDGEEQP